MKKNVGYNKKKNERKKSRRKDTILEKIMSPISVGMHCAKTAAFDMGEQMRFLWSHFKLQYSET